MIDEVISDVLLILSERCRQIEVSKGFDNDDVTTVALIHSEVSELLEGLRHGNPKSEHITAFTAAEEECADIIIRVLGRCQRNSWDIAGAILAKMEFNRNRPHKHGGKAF